MLTVDCLGFRVESHTPHGSQSPFGVASDETGQLNVALSGATEESALSEEGKWRGLHSSFLIPHS